MVPALAPISAGRFGRAMGSWIISQPDIALAAVVHALALERLYPGYRNGTSLQVSAPEESLRRIIGKPEDCQAISDLEQERGRWGDHIPGAPSDLWEWCLLQPREVLLDLLAFCAALSVNAVRAKNDRAGIARLRHADALARALGLDMTKRFIPRMDNYFGRINRASILDALQEAKGVALRQHGSR
jgi:ParB family chromosome partitioning protein